VRIVSACTRVPLTTGAPLMTEGSLTISAGIIGRFRNATTRLNSFPTGHGRYHPKPPPSSSPGVWEGRQRAALASGDGQNDPRHTFFCTASAARGAFATPPNRGIRQPGPTPPPAVAAPAARQL